MQSSINPPSSKCLFFCRVSKQWLWFCHAAFARFAVWSRFDVQCYSACLQGDEAEVLRTLFCEDLQSEQHRPASVGDVHLVTVTITIHDEALQQALQQAQHDLQRAWEHSTQLEAQADSLRAELQQAVSISAAAPTQRTTVTELSIQDPHRLHKSGSTAHILDQSDSAAQSLEESTSAAQASEEPASSAQGSEQPVAEMYQLHEQVHVLEQHATDAAAQQATAVDVVADLQRQLAQAGSSLLEGQGATQTLRRHLEVAEISVAEMTTRVQHLRYVTSYLWWCAGARERHADAYVGSALLTLHLVLPVSSLQ